MTPKERLLASIQGREIDRFSWSPNLAYWWEHSEEAVVAMGEVEFLKSIGADPLIRGHFAYQPGSRSWDNMMLFDTSYDNSCRVWEETIGEHRKVVYETPLGSLVFGYNYSKSGNTWFLREHGVKEEADFKILAYLKEHTILTPNYQRFDQEASDLGEEGLMVPILVPDLKSAFQAMVEYWVGTEGISYAVYDYPEAVEEALAAMRKLNLKAAEICASSKAECFLTWEDSSTTNISPALYEKYIAPEINDWCDFLHKKGKLYIQHACGHLKQLMPILAQTGIDAIESISPPPTGNIEIWEAREALPDRIALIGGIEAVNFKELHVTDLKAYAEKLIGKMQGTAYVLANSDSCPPYVELDKFHMLGELMRELCKKQEEQI
ncbi:MAG: hypothetical protein HFI41_01350 [Lachnospiraceae bacterium]|nr:hypothetical protein [Lachnospiraceae bacterium]